jgi:hypothetical protein
MLRPLGPRQFLLPLFEQISRRFVHVAQDFSPIMCSTTGSPAASSIFCFVEMKLLPPLIRSVMIPLFMLYARISFSSASLLRLRWLTAMRNFGEFCFKIGDGAIMSISYGNLISISFI